MTAEAARSATKSAHPAVSVRLGIVTARPDSSAATEQYIRASKDVPGIEMWFRSFDAPLFYSREFGAVHALGAIPMVTWDPVTSTGVIPFSQIIAGKYDSYLRAQAASAAAIHKPVYVRLAHEMNVQSAATPWGPGQYGNTPANYIGAWRHIVTIFRQQGASNVRWVWAPNTDCNGKCPFTAYYPGNAWVNDVGLDGYNFAKLHHVAWMSLAQIFGSSYRRLTALSSKPVMFTETASTSDGGNKARWITQGFLNAIPKLFPRVVAVIWWQRKSDGTDWRINSSPAVSAAWRAVTASPYYGGQSTALARARAAKAKSRRTARSRRNARRSLRGSLARSWSSGIRR